jgi:hypothetical protein
MHRARPFRSSIALARAVWPGISRRALRGLRELIETHELSIESGDLLYLDNRWYITHTGLVRLARRKRCAGIHVQPVHEFCDLKQGRWAFEATVFTTQNCKGFVGHGDADPSNVSHLVRGAEMRMAETRAVNRALRKAYGIGICSVEELGSFSGPLPPAAGQKNPIRAAEPTKGTGHHPLRDRLCLLIRQHQLDPALVKAYAADYCDVTELRQASRERIATFVRHLAECAQNDREGLLCQLNSYAPPRATEALVKIANDSTATEPEKAAGAA